MNLATATCCPSHPEPLLNRLIMVALMSDTPRCEGACVHAGTSAITVSHDGRQARAPGGTARRPLAADRRGRRRPDQRLPELPGRPRVLATDGAGLRVRPAGVRPLAGRRGSHPGRGQHRCDAAVPGLVPDRAAAGPAGRERVLDPRRPQRRLRAGHHQPAAGRRLRLVRVLGDAGPGRAGPRSREQRRPGGRPPGSAAGCWPTWAGRSGGPGCGSASRGGCRGGWTGPRPPRCWAASAPTGTGRSPG